MKKLYILFLLLPGLVVAQCEQGTTGIISASSGVVHSQGTSGTVLNSLGPSPALGIGDFGEENPLLYVMSQWIGGITPDQQLKLAADTYGTDGADFYPGPLTADGTAEVSLETCGQYDVIIRLFRSWSEQHRAYFDCLNDPDCDEEMMFPNGYVIPEEFFTYPAHGNVDAGQAFDLLPYFDYDQNNFYDPTGGDYPLFGNEDDCCNTLKGDECYVWIMNDKGNVHTASGGDMIGMEIHHMVYRYYSEEYFNAVFHRTKFINRGTQTLSDTYIGHFLDPDIGNFADDYAVFVPEENAMIAFNGGGVDEGTDGFGNDTPALVFRLLEGPPMDFDGVDNDDDGIVDNETLGLGHGLFYDPFAILPSQSLDYYNWMAGYFVNGQEFQENGVTVNFQHYGIPETIDEALSDVRVMCSTAPFTLTPGMEFCTNSVLCWALADEGEGPLNAAQNALEFSQDIQALEEQCFGCVPPGISIVAQPSGDGFSFWNISQADEYLWDFGDGTTSTDPFPFHIFETGPTAEVTLTLTNDCGSVTGTITLDGVVGVPNANAELDNGLSAFPQPAGEILTVKMDFEAKDQIIRLFDATGQLVLTAQALKGQTQIDVSALPPGVYILSVQREDGMLESLRVVR
ncbi:MAG: T9SS type A sorting domain-containing protein [Flavobacteriales bacterium]|nr:T9SS type A sorting domain-containing protein [Flavobacteriales bacterium]